MAHAIDVVVFEQIVALKDGKGYAVNIAMNISKSQLEQVEVFGYNSHNNKTINIGKAGVIDKDLRQSVQIINEQVISDQQVIRLSDALKNANGIALGANRGGENENFYARGYSLGANNIFKNGIRTNNCASIEASTLEAVEILKGSAALQYGGVSGGAVINMVTKNPKFNYGGEVSFRMGSYDFYKPTVDFYGLGKLSYITNAFNYYIHENYSVNPIAPRSFMATLAYKFEKR